MKILQKVFLLLILSSISFFGIAQETNWVQKMMSPNGNFYEIQDQFYEDWDGYEYTKGKGWKQFHRWEWFWKTRVLPDGSFPDFNRRWDEIKEHQTLSKGMNNFGGDWQPIGPFNWQNTGSWSPGQGRVNFIKEHPTDPNTIFVGAPAGGIWKTIDNGINWAPVSDHIAVIGIASIAICNSNPDIMYAATGDPDGGDTYSVGVLKSTDGGDTWNEVGSVPYELRDILVDPNDPDLVYIAATTGVFSSTDGGLNWNQIRQGNTRQMKFKVGDPQSIFCVSSDRFYVTNDAGQNWTESTGLDTIATRMVFDVTEANSNYVYVSVAGQGNTYSGIYRSTDGGYTFSVRDTTEDLYNGSNQSWYDLAICVSDTDPNTLVHGVLNLWRSTNGGSGWSQINSWNNAGSPAYTHADIHFLDYQNGTLYCGSDGGIYRSTNNGNNFSDITQGIQIGQFYTIAGAQSDVNRITGGLQDNGGFAWDGSTWKVFHGADGMGSAVKEANSNHIYSMIQYGDLRFSNNGGNSSTGLGSPEDGAWVTPMEYDNQQNRVVAGYNDLYAYSGGWNQISTYPFPELLQHIELYQANTNIMYVATNWRLYKTTNGGTNITDITSGLQQLMAGNQITSIEVDPINSDRVWVTVSGWTNNHKVMYSADGGTTWSNISNDGSFPNVICNIVKYDASSSNNSLYAGTDVGVYHYNDDLGTWIPYMTNLPNVIVNDLEINESSNIIRAGTYGRGVWQSGTYPESLIDEDAGIKRIIHPEGDICGDNVEPKVVIENFGMNNLYSFVLKYQIDNNTPDSIVWSGNLTSYDSVTITLPSFASSGTHSFKAWTKNPNAILDVNNDNDTLITTYNTVAGDRTVTVEITEDCRGSETTWSLINSSLATVASGGPYTDGNEGLTHHYNVCVDFDCYDFVINDVTGDGLEGSQVNAYGCTTDGNYIVTSENGDTLAEMNNADFGSSETTNFCLTQATPVADFSANFQNGCTNTPINFDDLSSGYPDTWSWTFTGGTPNNSSSSNPNVTYATPGVYEVVLTVTNGSGTDTKTESTFITITESPVLALTAYNVDCFAQCSGSINTSISNGTTPFNYEWSNHDDLDSIYNLCPGNYTVQIEDQNGCTDFDQTTITQPDLLELSVDTTSSNCGSNNGSAILTITGGTNPITQNWNGADPNNLAAGIYPYTIEDANGCVRVGSVTIENINMPEVTVSTQNVDCNGDNTGTAMANVTSGTSPYVIDWNGADENNMAYGQYTVTVTDDVGCIVNEDFWIYQSSTINMTPTVTHEILGSDGEIAMAVNGGSFPYTYSWTNGETTKDITGLTQGSYTLTVIDNKQCDTSITVLVENHLSIEENNIHGAIIYPNPVGNTLNISASTESIVFDLFLIDIRGRTVYQLNSYDIINGLSINMNSFESGLYLLKLVNQTEEISYKLIKQ
jgi:PKD repeat protein